MGKFFQTLRWLPPVNYGSGSVFLVIQRFIYNRPTTSGYEENLRIYSKFSRPPNSPHPQYPSSTRFNRTRIPRTDGTPQCEYVGVYHRKRGIHIPAGYCMGAENGLFLLQVGAAQLPGLCEIDQLDRRPPSKQDAVLSRGRSSCDHPGWSCHSLVAGSSRRNMDDSKPS